MVHAGFRFYIKPKEKAARKAAFFVLEKRPI